MNRSHSVHSDHYECLTLTIVHLVVPGAARRTGSSGPPWRSSLLTPPPCRSHCASLSIALTNRWTCSSMTSFPCKGRLKNLTLVQGSQLHKRASLAGR